MQFSKYIALIGIISLFSCSEQQARKPISHTSGTFMKESIKRNKKLNANEEKTILKIIKKDTALSYQSSSNGFWFAYVTKSTETDKPEKGEIAYFDYEIQDLYGNAIYTKDELKPQEYVVDKQSIISGLRLGLKLMNKGDELKFIFPSQFAYGYHGDKNKIGTNQPIVCLVKLTDIKKDSNLKP